MKFYSLYILALVFVVITKTKGQTDLDVIWVNSAGGNGTDVGNSISVDKSGGVFSTGSFELLANFGPQVLNTYNLYTSKVDNNGSWLWTEEFGSIINQSSSDDTTNGIINDDDGNVFVTGSYTDIMTFGPFMLNVSNGLGTMYVFKLNSVGDWFWVTAPTGNCTASAQDISFDGTNLLVGGKMVGTCTFGSDILTSSDVSPIVAKLDTDGNWLSGILIDVSSGSSGIINSIETFNDLIYVTGTFNGNMTIGPDFLMSEQIQLNAFIAKLDSGSWSWGRQSESSGLSVDIGYSITLDVDENIYVTGVYTTNTTFGTDVLVPNLENVSHIFVTRMSSTGDWIWTVTTNVLDGVIPNTGISKEIVTFNNSLYITGNLQGSSLFGDTVFNTTERQIIIASLDLDGNWTDVIVFLSNTEALNYNFGLANDNSSLYSTSTFMGTTQFSNFTLDSDSKDIYILKISILDSSQEIPSKIVIIIIIIILLLLLVIIIIIIAVKYCKNNKKCCFEEKDEKDKSRTWNIDMDET